MRVFLMVLESLSNAVQPNKMHLLFEFKVFFSHLFETLMVRFRKQEVFRLKRSNGFTQGKSFIKELLHCPERQYCITFYLNGLVLF